MAIDHDDELDECVQLLLDVEKLLAPLDWDDHRQIGMDLERLQSYFKRQIEVHADAIADGTDVEPKPFDEALAMRLDGPHG